MFDGVRRGPVVCRSCGRLVDVDDQRCPHCGARWPALWGYSRLLRQLGGMDENLPRVIVAGCVILYALSLLIDPQGISSRGFLDILAPSTSAVYRLGAAGIVPVWEHGRWWTLLSAGWLHGSLLHIFFNMYWVLILVPPVTQIYGAGRTMLLYTVASVCGFALSSSAIVFLSRLNPGMASFVAKILGAAGFTLGASAALMGLLGAMVAYSRRGGPSSYSAWAGRYIILFLIFGIFMRGMVDNWAHIGGLVGGYVCGALMNPHRPERANDLLAGLLCLVATVAAVVVSFATP